MRRRECRKKRDRKEKKKKELKRNVGNRYVCQDYGDMYGTCMYISRGYVCFYIWT